MLTNNLLTLSPPLSGSKKKTKIWNYQLSNLGYLPIRTIFKDTLGIHFALISLLQGIK